MPWSMSQVDTSYDNSHPWDSLFNGLTSSGAFQPSPRQQRLIDIARSTADPGTPEEMIRDTMTVGQVPDAGPRRPEPTIDTVLDGSALQPQQLYDRAPTDFSGTPAGMEASSRNSIAW